MWLGGLGEHFSSPSRQTVFGEFQAKNFIASSSNDLQELSGNETSNYDRHVGCLLVAFSQKLRGSALIINALPPVSFCKNASPPYFFHGAFAPSFIWSRRP